MLAPAVGEAMKVVSGCLLGQPVLLKEEASHAAALEALLAKLQEAREGIAQRGEVLRTGRYSSSPTGLSEEEAGEFVKVAREQTRILASANDASQAGRAGSYYPTLLRLPLRRPKDPSAAPPHPRWVCDFNADLFDPETSIMSQVPTTSPADQSGRGPHGSTPQAQDDDNVPPGVRAAWKLDRGYVRKAAWCRQVVALLQAEAGVAEGCPQLGSLGGQPQVEGARQGEPGGGAPLLAEARRVPEELWAFEAADLCFRSSGLQHPCTPEGAVAGLAPHSVRHGISLLVAQLPRSLAHALRRALEKGDPAQLRDCFGSPALIARVARFCHLHVAGDCFWKVSRAGKLARQGGVFSRGGGAKRGRAPSEGRGSDSDSGGSAAASPGQPEQPFPGDDAAGAPPAAKQRRTEGVVAAPAAAAPAAPPPAAPRTSLKEILRKVRAALQQGAGGGAATPSPTPAGTPGGTPTPTPLGTPNTTPAEPPHAPLQPPPPVGAPSHPPMACIAAATRYEVSLCAGAAPLDTEVQRQVLDGKSPASAVMGDALSNANRDEEYAEICRRATVFGRTAPDGPAKLTHLRNSELELLGRPGIPDTVGSLERALLRLNIEGCRVLLATEDHEFPLLHGTATRVASTCLLFCRLRDPSAAATFLSGVLQSIRRSLLRPASPFRKATTLVDLLGLCSLHAALLDGHPPRCLGDLPLGGRLQLYVPRNANPGCAGLREALQQWADTVCAFVSGMKEVPVPEGVVPSCVAGAVFLQNLMQHYGECCNTSSARVTLELVSQNACLETGSVASVLDEVRGVGFVIDNDETPWEALWSVVQMLCAGSHQAVGRAMRSAAKFSGCIAGDVLFAGGTFLQREGDTRYGLSLSRLYANRGTSPMFLWDGFNGQRTAMIALQRYPAILSALVQTGSVKPPDVALFLLLRSLANPSPHKGKVKKAVTTSPAVDPRSTPVFAYY